MSTVSVSDDKGTTVTGCKGCTADVHLRLPGVLQGVEKKQTCTYVRTYVSRLNECRYGETLFTCTSDIQFPHLLQ